MASNEMLYVLKELNESFEQRLLFRLFCHAGFYSEYNNMLLAILFCLKNKIQFNLCSKLCIPIHKNGWSEYFIPFCNEENSEELNRFNLRTYLFNSYSEEELRQILSYNNTVKRKNNYEFLMIDIWDYIRSDEFYKSDFYIPELKIDGNLISACKVINECIYNFNEETKSEIDGIIKKVDLPQEYVSVHIRCGDKVFETALISPDDYIIRLQQHFSCKNLFVATDDYEVFSYLKDKYPMFNFYTTSEPKDSGHIQNVANAIAPEIVRLEHVKLFSTMEILKKSIIHIGTNSSNMGIFMKFARDDGYFSMDYEDEIWR